MALTKCRCGATTDKVAEFIAVVRRPSDAWWCCSWRCVGELASEKVNAAKAAESTTTAGKAAVAEVMHKKVEAEE